MGQGFRIRVVQGTWLARSRRVVRSAWRTRRGGKLGPAQQLLTSGDLLGQVPALMPTETGVSLGLAGGGEVMIFFVLLGIRAVFKEETGIVAMSSQNNSVGPLQAGKCNSSSHLPVPICFLPLWCIHFIYDAFLKMESGFKVPRCCCNVKIVSW